MVTLALEGGVLARDFSSLRESLTRSLVNTLRTLRSIVGFFEAGFLSLVAGGMISFQERLVAHHREMLSENHQEN